MDKVRIEVEIERDLLEEAERRGLDVEAEAESALRRRLWRPAPMSGEAVQRWREENAEAIQLSNAELERNGLWSDGHRLF